MAGFDDLMSDEELNNYSRQQDLQNARLRQQDASASQRQAEDSANRSLSIGGIAKQLAGLASPITAPFKLAYDMSQANVEGVPLTPFLKELPGNTLSAAGDALSEALQHPLHTATEALPLAGEVAGTLVGGTIGIPALGAMGGRLLGEAGKSLINWEKPDYNELAVNTLLAPLGAGATTTATGALKNAYKEEAGMNIARDIYGVKPEGLSLKAGLGSILPESRKGVASMIIQDTVQSVTADQEAQAMLEATKRVADERRDAWLEGLGRKVLKNSEKPLSAAPDVEAAYLKGAPSEDALANTNMNTRMGMLSADSELADYLNSATPQPGGMRQIPLPRKMKQLSFGDTAEEASKPLKDYKWQYSDLPDNPELEKLLAADEEAAPGSMRQGRFTNTTVKGKPAFKVADTAEQTAKKQEKADAAARSMGTELEMQPRLEKATLSLAEDPAFATIAEDLPEFLKPRLEPREVAPPTWWDRLRRMNFMSDREDNAFIQDLQKGSTVKGVWNPQRILRQAQDPWAIAAAEHGNDSETMIHMLDHLFQSRAAKLVKETGFSNDDHDIQMILSRTPRLMEIYRENPTAGAQQMLKQFTEETGQRVAVSGAQDIARLERSLAFRQQWQQRVVDPMSAISKRIHPDPNYLRAQADYFLPTYSHRWQAEELASQMESLKGHYANLSPDLAAGDVGSRIQMQIAALDTKLKAATQFGTEQDAAMRKAFQLYDEQGIVPKTINNPAFKNKYTDMTFDMDMTQSMQDYIHSFIRKNVMDITLPRLAEDAKNAASPRMQEYISRYAQDLLGRRRLAGIKSVVSQIQGIPLVGEHVSEDMVRKVVDGISSWNAMWNIGFNPRFYPMQMSQNLINLFPLIRADEAKAHGMQRAVFDFQRAYEEAAQAGAVQSGLGAIWEDVKASGDPNSKLVDWAQAANKLPGASEAFNRVLGYHAALKDAELAGLTGREARRKAVATTVMANFGYSAAHRPQFSGSFMGSMLMRYRSFGLQYKNYLAHLIEHDPRAAAESLVTAISIAGTGGIPLFGLIKQLGGLAGTDVRDVHPFQELTGLDMATSANPLETGIPTDFASLAGPILGPAVNMYQGATEGGEGGLQKLVGGVKGAMGVLPKTVIEGTAELARGGVTTTPAGHKQLERPTSTILKHMVNLAPSARGEIAQANKDITQAVESGDNTALEAVIAQHANNGFVKGQSVARQARGRERAEEKGKYKSALDMFLGR